MTIGCRYSVHTVWYHWCENRGDFKHKRDAIKRFNELVEKAKNDWSKKDRFADTQVYMLKWTRDLSHWRQIKEWKYDKETESIL